VILEDGRIRQVSNLNLSHHVQQEKQTSLQQMNYMTWNSTLI